jgi:hypothetical protein
MGLQLMCACARVDIGHKSVFCCQVSLVMMGVGEYWTCMHGKAQLPLEKNSGRATWKLGE